MEKALVVDFCDNEKFKKIIALLKKEPKANSLTTYKLESLLCLKQIIGSPMGSALAQSISVAFECAIEKRIENTTKHVTRPLLQDEKEYLLRINLFLSKRYIDDKGSFRPKLKKFLKLEKVWTLGR